jgi:hypothetical protein
MRIQGPNLTDSQSPKYLADYKTGLTRPVDVKSINYLGEPKFIKSLN